ncbi:hypothetical protein Tco_0227878 [Tanacetum coccineum]
MSKTHFLLQKKLHELESEFTHVSNYLLKTTSGPNLIINEFKHRLVFYRKLLTAEIAVHKIKPRYLDGFEKRLAELETSFNNHYMFTKDSGKVPQEVGNEAFEKFNEEVASLSDLENTFDYQDLKIDYNTKHGFSVVVVWMMLGAILMLMTGREVRVHTRQSYLDTVGTKMRESRGSCPLAVSRGRAPCWVPLTGSTKEFWDQYELKYMAEDASSKKFFVSNFDKYKMVDLRSVMEQHHELLRILGQFTHHSLNMDESIFVYSIIDKLPPSWKDFKHSLK